MCPERVPKPVTPGLDHVVMTVLTTSAARSAYLTVAEVAGVIHCSEPTVRRRIRDGELPAVQLGRPGSAVRVPRTGLQAGLYAERTEEG